MNTYGKKTGRIYINLNQSRYLFHTLCSVPWYLRQFAIERSKNATDEFVWYLTLQMSKSGKPRTYKDRASARWKMASSYLTGVWGLLHGGSNQQEFLWLNVCWNMENPNSWHPSNHQTPWRFRICLVTWTVPRFGPESCTNKKSHLNRQSFFEFLGIQRTNMNKTQPVFLGISQLLSNFNGVFHDTKPLQQKCRHLPIPS